MVERSPIIAVFPGAFDPITHGHLDIIRRGSRLFDTLIVAVGRNPEKTELFPAAERVEMLHECTHDVPNVRIDSYDGLTAEYVRRQGARVILRGIRDNVDLRGELRQANTNLLVGDVETVLLMTSDQHALTSSTLIKQIVEIGGYQHERLARLLPEVVLRRLEARFGRKGTAASGKS
jgi:pantetheine-phosphate adenylyltransferase